MGWNYYLRMILPDAEPRTSISLTREDEKRLFSKYRKAYLIRYCKDFDCLEDGEWWYCIKDDAYSVEMLNSKRRSYVRKSIASFYIKEVIPTEYVPEMYELINDSNSGYEFPVTLSKSEVEQKCKYIAAQDNLLFLAAFDKETNKFSGYLWINQKGHCFIMIEQHCLIEAEKRGCNAALVNALCEVLNSKLDNGYYICDGERTVVHKTAFQDYLIKYFGFRRAYCNLVIKYNPKYKLFIKIAFLSLTLFGGIIRLLVPKFYDKIMGMKTMDIIAGK